MKKLFVFLAIMAIAVYSFSANPQKRLVVVMTDTAEHFHSPVIAGDPVFIISTAQWYVLNKGIAVVDKYNMNYMITNSYATISYQTSGFTGTNINLTGNMTVGGNLAVTGSSTLHAVSATNITASVTLRFGNYFYGSGDSLAPITNNYGFVGTPTKKVGSIYSHYCTGDWGAFIKATGTYSKFTTDSATTFVGALTGAASLNWLKTDTGINSKLAAYYTTMTAIGLKANTANPTFTTGATAPIFTLTSTDTSSATAAVGSIFMRIASGDTSMWLLIRKTGGIHARWKKLSN